MKTRINALRLLTLTIGICLLLGASPPRAYAQREPPFALEGLLESLSYKILDSKTLVKKVKERGVNFRLYAMDERKIREAGAYLPPAGLDKLVEAVRGKYRVDPRLVLSGDIEQVEIMQDENRGFLVFVRLTVKNIGSPTIAHNYTLRVIHTTSTIFEFKPRASKRFEATTLTLPGADKAVVIGPQDSLLSKTSQAIGQKSKVSGWLKFSLPVVQLKLADPRLAEPNYLRQPGTIYVVSFSDAYGYTSKAYYEMR